MLKLPVPLQATLDVLPAEKQRQLTQSHQRTTATIAAMRQTLHDEHSCLVQVRHLRTTPLTDQHAGRFCTQAKSAVIQQLVQHTHQPSFMLVLSLSVSSGCNICIPAGLVASDVLLSDWRNGAHTFYKIFIAKNQKVLL